MSLQRYTYDGTGKRIYGYLDLIKSGLNERSLYLVRNYPLHTLKVHPVKIIRIVHSHPETAWIIELSQCSQNYVLIDLNARAISKLRELYLKSPCNGWTVIKGDGYTDFRREAKITRLGGMRGKWDR